jgi:hypothetical protein
MAGDGPTMPEQGVGWGEGSDTPPRSLYVHVPFCTRRCSYCDFAVQATREAPTDDWLDAVATEMRLLAEDRGWTEPLRLDTLYVGGGTPVAAGHGRHGGAGGKAPALRDMGPRDRGVDLRGQPGKLHRGACGGLARRGGEPHLAGRADLPPGGAALDGPPARRGGARARHARRPRRRVRQRQRGPDLRAAGEAGARLGRRPGAGAGAGAGARLAVRPHRGGRGAAGALGGRGPRDAGRRGPLRRRVPAGAREADGGRGSGTTRCPTSACRAAGRATTACTGPARPTRRWAPGRTPSTRRCGAGTCAPGTRTATRCAPAASPWRTRSAWTRPRRRWSAPGCCCAPTGATRWPTPPPRSARWPTRGPAAGWRAATAGTLRLSAEGWLLLDRLAVELATAAEAGRAPAGAA